MSTLSDNRQLKIKLSIFGLRASGQKLMFALRDFNIYKLMALN